MSGARCTVHDAKSTECFNIHEAGDGEMVLTVETIETHGTAETPSPAFSKGAR